MRPTYETSKDICAEEHIIEKVSNAWGCEVVKTKRFYPFDYMCMRNNKASAFLEIKNRHYRHDDFPTYLLSLHKLHQCMGMALFVNIPFVLVIGYQDGIYWMNRFDIEDVRVGGRKDRGDDQDIEPCCLISMGNLKLLK